MYIHEAIEEAVEKEACITRLDHEGKYSFKIKITRKWPDYFKIAKAIKGRDQLILYQCILLFFSNHPLQSSLKRESLQYFRTDLHLFIFFQF